MKRLDEIEDRCKKATESDDNKRVWISPWPQRYGASYVAEDIPYLLRVARAGNVICHLLEAAGEGSIISTLDAKLAVGRYKDALEGK